MSTRIEAQHHSVSQPRERGKFIKVSKNGNGNGKATMTVPTSYGLNRIIRPQARYNWLMPNVAAITPQYVELVMNGALMGNQVQQWELFDLMLRTWPELSQCCQELTYGVLRKKIVFEAFHYDDEKPTPNAIDRAKTVSACLGNMNGNAQDDGSNLEGTIKNILDAWFRGASVSEIVWEAAELPTLGTLMSPRSTYWVHPVSYAFNVDNTIGLRPLTQQPTAGGTWPFSTTTAQPIPADLQPFPPNKFLVAVHKSKTGFPLGGPLLTPLAWWWCAANFSSDWLMNLAQVFGLPFRWASYDPNAPQDTIDAICTMLQNMGSNAWAAFPTGVTLEMKEPARQGSDHSPQGELLDRADRYARLLILGQTMTGTHGSMGKGGGQAFGKVEKDVKEDRIDAAGKFAANVINKQLVTSILMLNYGDDSEAPHMKFLEDEVADLTEAQRDQVLVNAGLPIGVDYLRKKYDIPEPSEGEEVVGGVSLDLGREQPVDEPVDQPLPDDPNAPPADDEPAKGLALHPWWNETEKALWAEMAGHPFRGNQWTKFSTANYTGDEEANKFVKHMLSDRTATGMLRTSTDKYGEMVRALPDKSVTPVRKWITKYGTPYEQRFVMSHLMNSERERLGALSQTASQTLPTRPSHEFPSITHSAENERRIALNSKLEELNEIEDDSVFARELLQLTEGLK